MLLPVTHMNLNLQIEQWLAEQKRAFFSSADPLSVPQPASRPFVTLCYAQSWDGCITTGAGTSLALSSTESTRLTHQLRSLHEGILVGIGTVLSDDPLLNVREWAGPNPQPVVLDSHLRMPATARLGKLPGRRCWVLTTAECTVVDAEGPEYLQVPADAEGRVSLDAALQLLCQKGIRSLMVEGGGSVITAFLQARLADALVLTLAPTVIGGYRAVGDLGFTTRQQLPQIAPLHTRQLGEDLIMWGKLHYRDHCS